MKNGGTLMLGTVLCSCLILSNKQGSFLNRRIASDLMEMSGDSHYESTWGQPPATVTKADVYKDHPEVMPSPAAVENKKPNNTEDDYPGFDGADD